MVSVIGSWKFGMVEDLDLDLEFSASWKAGFFVKPWTEWKHVFSHKRQGQVL